MQSNSMNTQTKSLWLDVVSLLLHRRELIGKWAWLLGLAAFFSLEWVAHASSAVVEQFIEIPLYWLGWHPEGLANALAELVFPMLAFGIAVALLIWWVRRQRRDVEEDLSKLPIWRHRGLIAALSLFDPPNGPSEATKRKRDEINTALIPAVRLGPAHRSALLKMLYQTAWGPLMAAIELHGTRLQHLWLLCSPAVKADLQMVKQCVEFLTDGSVQVEPIWLQDANSVREARIEIQAVYQHKINSIGLREKQVICDMTSGTAAITAGMVLATLDEPRHLQYLSQVRSCLIVEDAPRTDLTAVFRYVATSPADVASAFASFFRSHAGDGSDEGAEQ